jgi:hypothetical protein
MHAFVKSTQSTETATEWNALKDGQSSKGTQHPWHHSVDRKPIFIQANFEGGLSVSLSRKLMSIKRGHFFMGNSMRMSKKKKMVVGISKWACA